MKGGARGRSGPAPDPNALRRDRDKGEWTHLPAAGRDGPTPEWPLTKATARELELWEREWRRPQALMWEANGQETEVALFVRSLATAEKPKAHTTVRTLVKQQMEALGLTLPGLRSNRWVIDDGDTAKQELPATDPEGPSAKERFKLIAGGA